MAKKKRIQKRGALNVTDISGGFRGEPRTVEEFLRRELADPKTRTAVEAEVERMRAEQDRPVQSGNAVVVQDTSLVDPQGANAPECA